MAVLMEGKHAGEFLVSEASGSRSREAITIAGGQNLEAGAVLGRTGSNGSAVATASAGNTGDGAVGAITVGTAAKNGRYRPVIVAAATGAGSFIVEGPSDVSVGHGGAVGTEFSEGGLTFTLADGDTDFVVGDALTITVSGVTDQYKEYDPANSDGSQIAVAVLYGSVDATDAAMKAVAIMRDAEVKAER